MPRQGETFHKLVEIIERAVNRQPDVTIESPKYLPDTITGHLREHDIVLTYDYPQRQLIVAIECRDRSRPVTTDQVEAFHTKCRDTGVNKGVMVASGGFAKTARTKAAHYGIDCLTLAQVVDVDWVAQQEVVIRRRDPRRTNVNLGVPLSVWGKNARLFLRIIDGEDEEIDIQVVADGDGASVRIGQPDNLVRRVWRDVPDPTSELSGSVRVEVANAEEFYFLDDEGVEHPLRGLVLDFDWEAIETTSRLTFYRYGAELAKPVYEVMATEVETFGDISGRIMLIKNAEMGISFQFLPETKNETGNRTAALPLAPDVS